MSKDNKEKNKDALDHIVDGLGAALEMLFVLIFSIIMLVVKKTINKFTAHKHESNGAGLSPICAKISREHKEASSESD